MINSEKYYNRKMFCCKLKSLKKYCLRTYKYLIFEVKQIDYSILENGSYSIDLPTPRAFKFVYGQIKLTFKVFNKELEFIDLEPSQFFLDGYIKDLEIYRLMHYRNEQDKFKIDLWYALTKNETKNERKQ